MSLSQRIAVRAVGEWLKSQADLASIPTMKNHLAFRARCYLALATVEIPPQAPGMNPPLLNHMAETLKSQDSDGSLSICLHGEMNMFSDTLPGIEKQIAEARRVNVSIRSCGGSSDTALRLFNAFADCGRRGIEVIAHVDDHSASGAIIALQGASLRRMNSDAIIMIHPPISTVVGTAEQLESEAARTRILQEKIIALYTERTGQPESTVRQWHSRNNYFSASQALEAGLIDEIVPAAKGIVPAEAVVDALNEQAFNSLVPAAGVDSLPFSAPGALRIEIPAEIPALNL